MYYNSTSDATTWDGQQLLSFKSSKGPSVAVHNNQMFIAFKGSSTKNVYLAKSSDGSNWSSSWRPNSSWKTEKGPAIASYNDQLYLAHRDLSKYVRYSSSANGVDSWAARSKKSGSRSGSSLTLAVY
jgi:GH43 family beta-xylosidase